VGHIFPPPSFPFLSIFFRGPAIPQPESLLASSWSASLIFFFFRSEKGLALRPSMRGRSPPPFSYWAFHIMCRVFSFAVPVSSSFCVSLFGRGLFVPHSSQLRSSTKLDFFCAVLKRSVLRIFFLTFCPFDLVCLILLKRVRSMEVILSSTPR